MISAETAYLFRHALLRDAAYQLQTPDDRAKLHELAFFLIEEAFGGRAPDSAPALASGTCATFRLHSTDAVASDLAQHAMLSSERRDSSIPGSCIELYMIRAAELASRSYDSIQAERLWMQIARRAEGALRAHALRRGAVEARHRCDWSAAEQNLLAALECAVACGDQFAEGSAHGELGNLYSVVNRGELAEHHLLAASARFENLDPRNASAVRMNLALLWKHSGRLDQAGEALQAALLTCRAIGDREGIAVARGSLADLRWTRGQTAGLEEEFREIIELHRKTGNRRYEGNITANLGARMLEIGRLSEAETLFAKAYAILTEIGDALGRSQLLELYGQLYCEMERFDDSAACYQRSHGVLREIGRTERMGIATGELAGLLFKQGKFQRAADLYEEAITDLRSHALLMAAGWYLCHLSICQLALGGIPNANSSWIQGTQLLTSLGERYRLKRITAEMHRACEGLGVQPFE